VIDAVLSPLASNKIYRICRGRFEPQILVLYKLIPIHHLPRFVAPRVAVWFRKAILCTDFLTKNVTIFVRKSVLNSLPEPYRGAVAVRKLPDN